MLTRILLVMAVLALALLWLRASRSRAQEKDVRSYPVQKTEAEWKAQLTAEQFRILRQKGTERAFTGGFHDHHESGRYLCVACSQVLFDSTSKFDSGTGWPSFFQPFRLGSLVEETDRSWGMTRVEVLCANCGGHLGHLFRDGPRPTGLRYCINSACLRFEPGSAGPGERQQEEAKPGK